MKKVIAIVGMPGAGKSEAAAFFQQKGFPILRFGDINEQIIKEEGLERTPENEKNIREKIRRELGMDAIAQKMLPKIKDALRSESSFIILDGLYSWEEYLYVQKNIQELSLLCIYAKPSLRYERLQNRKVRPFTLEEAKDRDISEIESTNKGGPIAIADYLIKNETTKEDLYNELEMFLHTLQHDSY